MEEDTRAQQPYSRDSWVKELEVGESQKDDRTMELEGESSKKEHETEDLESEVNDIKIQITKI